MNVMYIINGKPVPSKCYTEKYGTHQCTLAIREKLMQRHHVTVVNAIIEQVLRTKEADIGEEYLTTIRAAAMEYAEGIMRRLREHEYCHCILVEESREGSRMEGNHSIDFCFYQKGTKDFFLDHSLSDKESFLPRLFISVVADPQQDIHRDHDGIDDIEDECEIIVVRHDLAADTAGIP